MNKKIAIVGAGGHGKVVGEIALLNQYEIIDFFDDKYSEIKDIGTSTFISDLTSMYHETLKNRIYQT